MWFLIQSFPVFQCFTCWICIWCKNLFHICNLGFLKLQQHIKSYSIFGMKQKDVSIPIPWDTWNWTTVLFKEHLLSVISEAYGRWLTGRFQDVVVIKGESQMGMLLVVFPAASPWLKTWTNFIGALVDKMFAGKLIIDTKLNNPRGKRRLGDLWTNTSMEWFQILGWMAKVQKYFLLIVRCKIINLWTWKSNDTYHRMRVGFESQKNVGVVLVTCFCHCSTGADKVIPLEAQWGHCWVEGAWCSQQRLYRIKADTRVWCSHGKVDLKQLSTFQWRTTEMIVGIVK